MVLDLKELALNEIDGIYNCRIDAPAREHLEFYMYFHEFATLVQEGIFPSFLNDTFTAMTNYGIGIHNSIVKGEPCADKELFYQGYRLLHEGCAIGSCVQTKLMQALTGQPISVKFKELEKIKDSFEKTLQDFNDVLNAEKATDKSSVIGRETNQKKIKDFIAGSQDKTLRESIMVADILQQMTGKQDAR